MTSITKNLPWPIPDLGVNIIGQKCYVSLVENLNINDSECIKYAFSKVLGIGIVVGGSVMKVPQLILILKSRSAYGLSLPSYILETLAYAITLAYAARNGFPFSTYGENAFLAAQNTAITLLMLLYRATPAPTLALASLSALAVGGALAAIPMPLLALAQLATLPLGLAAKLPQITQNRAHRSTGQLSALAVAAQLAGCAARLFTTAAEVGDVVVQAGFVLAFALNAVVALQMWVYWGNGGAAYKHEEGLGAVGEKRVVGGQGVQGGKAEVGVGVPPQGGSRKWARKVD